MQELSRDTLEAIVGSIPAGVVVIEKEKGRTIYVNERAKQLFGVDPMGLELPEHSTKLFKLLTLNGDVYPPEQLPASLALLTGKNAQAEVVIERYDGSRVITKGSAKPIRNEKSEVIAAVAIFEDITDRKQAEEALRVTEEKFSKTFEGSPFAVTLTRVNDGTIVEVNEATLKLFGFTRSEIVGKTTYELQTWANINDRIVLAKELSQKGSFKNKEVALLKKDGTHFDVVMSGAIVSINAEKYWIASFNDITDRKKIEVACKESEERFRGLVESTSDWIWQVDQNAVYTYVSPKIKDILGYAPEEVLGKTPFDLMPKEESNKNAEKFENITKNKESFSGLENWNINKNGKLVLIETNGVPILNPDGDLIGYRGIDRDITERKKTEQSLIESEQLYRTLFDNSEDGFMLLEPILDESGKACDFRFLKLNSAYERQTGAKAADVLGKRATEVVPKLESGIISLSGEVAKTGRSTHAETYDKYSSKWYDSYYIPFAKGQVGILFRDITERKKAEETLRIEKERFRSLADSLPEIVFETDANGNLLFANARGFEITGYSKEDFDKGFDVFNLVALQDKEKVIDTFKKTLNNQPTPYNEFTIVRKDGSTFPAIIVANPIVNEGHPIGLRGLVIDITERKKAEEAIRQTEEKLQKIIDQSPVVFELYDKSGFQVQVNPAWDKLWGVPREFTLGKYNVLQSEQVIKNGWVPYIQRAYAGEIVKVPDLEYDASLDPSTKGLGRKRWLSTVIYPIRDESGHVTNIAILHEDITEKKALEKQLKDSERFAAIGQTAGMVGHDIRNPLQAVLSDTYLLKDELASMPEGENKEGVAESIDSIERNVAYINKIVQDLQDYSRQVVPEYSVADLSDVLVHVFETIGVPESINLSINVKDAEKIRIDPTLLQRAITNLVTNAIQAMPDGGKLEICGEKIDNSIVVTVSDTGGGIPDDVKPKLFTPMMTTKAKGQGFGLAASKRMIEAMKGTISFESETGKGTKFKIQLPLLIIQSKH